MTTMKGDEQAMEAVRLQETGKIPEAESLFRKILEKNPADFIALFSLGVIAFQRQDYLTALEFFRRAQAVQAGFPPLWFNAGFTLLKLGRLNEACEHLDRALHLDPGYEAARNLRAEITGKSQPAVPPSVSGTPKEATPEKLKRALELQGQNKLNEAEALFVDILISQATDLVALYSLGVIEQNRNNPEKALRYFQRGLELKPDYAPLWYNSGVVLHSLKRLDDALASYDRALSLNPAYKEAMLNRGVLLVEMKRHKDALLMYEDLLKIDPLNDKAWCNRGLILSDFKLEDLAIESFDRVLKISPEYEYALGLLCYAKMHACEWKGLDVLIPRVIEGVRAEKRVCRTQAFLAMSPEPQEHLSCARIFGQHFYPVQEPLWRGEIYDHRKIRLAYISPDFREHPVGHLTAGIFENHDKDRFEITAISLGIDDQSRLRKRMLSAFDRFVDARQMSSRDVASLLRSMETDIFVDLAGYTADSRTDILAWRPAPVQVNFLGYSSTMGLDYYDYIIADKHIIPEETRPCYSEKVVYMPDTYLPTDSAVTVAPKTLSREEYGLPPSGFVFCSFNHDYKINPPVFDIWMRLLKRIPGSILWLMKLNESAERNLRKEAAARGVDPERLVFATRVPSIEDHLARYRAADLFLDTTPYNAHSTTSDVLRVGLPVLTCRGKAFAGRVAAGLLRTVGLPEMITDTLEEYENLAFQLASNPSRLRAIRGRLLKNLETTRLFDSKVFCRNLEMAFRAMWDRYQRGMAPDHLVVAGSG